MKVLLVNPCLRPDSERTVYPVGLCYIANAITRSSHQVEVLDMELERLSDEEFEDRISSVDFDVFGLGCIVTGYGTAKRLMAIARKVNPEAVIVAGNSVASSIPDTLLDMTDADIAVIGEGEKTVVDVLDCIERKGDLQGVPGICFKENGRLVATPMRKPWIEAGQIPRLDWSHFNIEAYLDNSKLFVIEPFPVPYDQIRQFPVNTARGCPFRCTFCYHCFREYPYRFRPPEKIVEEISFYQAKFGVNYISFWDELTFMNRKQADSLVTAIIESGLEFYWTGTCRGGLFTEDDIDLALKFKQAGCLGLGYSLESADTGILKAMNKKMNLNTFAAQKRVLDRAGVVSYTSIVLGYPQETEETIRKTYDFCYDLDLYPSTGYLLPQPGTKMYQIAKEMGLIPNVEEYLLAMGDRQDLRLNMTKIPDEMFEALVKENLKRISDKLNLNLDTENLIKSKRYKYKASPDE